ncbi:MAG: hypothetical protein SFV20_12095 [Sphingopyxis sp.]|nr:hypothetical protein [Sphingopyxis sp.]
MKTIVKIAAIAGLSVAASAQASLPILYEESFARAEEKLIIASPIAGIQNRLWFDYRIDVIEAQKELARDLRKASDIEDRRDAWEEYGVELSHERIDYVEAMARKGYRQGKVTVGN